METDRWKIGNGKILPRRLEKCCPMGHGVGAPSPTTPRAVVLKLAMTDHEEHEEGVGPAFPSAAWNSCLMDPGIRSIQPMPSWCPGCHAFPCKYHGWLCSILD